MTKSQISQWTRCWYLTLSHDFTHISAPPPIRPFILYHLKIKIWRLYLLNTKKIYSYHLFWRLTGLLNVIPKIIDFWYFGKIVESLTRAPGAPKCKKSHVDAHESLETWLMVVKTWFLIVVNGHNSYFNILHITSWGGGWGGVTISCSKWHPFPKIILFTLKIGLYANGTPPPHVCQKL